MTVLEAYRLIQTDAPQTTKLANGRAANGRAILSLFKRLPAATQAPILAKLADPAKSLITAALASTRV